MSQANQASAAVEAFLRERTRPEPRDRGAILDLRLAIARVCEAEIVRRDPVASRILRDMAFAETMEDLHVEIDRLGNRIARLTARTGPSDPPMARPARRMLRL